MVREIAPVVSGLAVGIAFVVLFSMLFSMVFFPATALTDDKLVERTRSLEEVRLFLEMHPDAEISIERDDALRKIEVRYSVEKQVQKPSGFDSGISTKELVASVDAQGDAGISMMVCNDGGRGIVMFHVTIDDIANRCIVESEMESGLFEPDNSGDELDEIDPLAFGNVFDLTFRNKALTVAVNAVDGINIGFYSAREIEPVVIAEYPLLQEMIEEADRAGMEGLVIYRNISGSDADFLTDGRLAFVQTRLELARYDEVSSFIHFGSDISFIIRVFEAENGDPFAPDEDSGDETGLLEPETEVGEPIPLEVFDDNNTSIEITYEED